MNAAKMMHKQLNLHKSLEYADVSRRRWYYKPKPREIGLNPVVVDTVYRISHRQPTYGTRRMAVQVARDTGIAVNRKQMQRIFRKIGYADTKDKKLVSSYGTQTLQTQSSKSVVGDWHYLHLVWNRWMDGSTVLM